MSRVSSAFLLVVFVCVCLLMDSLAPSVWSDTNQALLKYELAAISAGLYAPHACGQVRLCVPCLAGTWAFVSQNSTNFEVALATALVPLLRYVKEARIPVAKPVAARFLPDETFTQASGGYKIGIFLPGVTKVWLYGKQSQSYCCLWFCKEKCAPSGP